MIKIKKSHRFSNKQRSLLRQYGGEWLRKHRVSAGLKQRDVSERLDGMETAAYISVIEKGGPNLPEERWGDYAEILGLDWDYFCEHMLMFYKPSIYIGVYQKNPFDVINGSEVYKLRAKK